MVALRSGVGGWLRDTLDQTVEWWTTRKNPRVDLARWDARGVEIATAGTLGRLDPTYRVIHDRVIPGSVDDAVTIDHIVIGPPGITVVASVRLGAGPISQRPDGSLWQQGRSLDRLLREAWWQAWVVQTRIALSTSAVLAVHSPPRSTNRCRSACTNTKATATKS